MAVHDSQEMVLITGASGELGQALIKELGNRNSAVIAADVRSLPPELTRYCSVVLEGERGDVTTSELGYALVEYPITRIFHLAAVLSTAAERDPVRAHQINVQGTLNILELAQAIGQRYERTVQVIFPSTIAVYGFASVHDKHQAGKVTEDNALEPRTLYGVTKLHCERLGIYYSHYYKQLSGEQSWVDFRALRFPGLISAETLPTGGTSDYAPEMLHAAARGVPYLCFVRPDTQIPFMAMPDGVRALLLLAQAERSRLSRQVYNIGAFAPTAAEIATTVAEYFPSASITFQVDTRRQAIVDSWCADVNDNAARRDWGWEPQYDYVRAFAEYLVPAIKQRYATVTTENV
ncbi:MAG: NAD-dependent epimerase/dehydratase family protein [Bacteroidota bacterium]|nr:NAD-dependent epimerase/dehydratase family protein [Candidatus Kapabacteria bacterium]MCS7302128.1 NAD-dependent epimerase/dehydratase family protein [Candidatus Kapabacteria bacterium]MCX7936480.1 NAD-dependent epimerase/dehydratase family protein [Chlorobiota bacterium]MDW8074641.1 NAD-dependent epimerase/dehydratase family protein [Bacteroidota bacterium]MDW8270883.1 NAD-dependent epimerase/dehydratase family protein [Bacteroidota bacterium]